MERSLTCLLVVYYLSLVLFPVRIQCHFDGVIIVQTSRILLFESWFPCEATPRWILTWTALNNIIVLFVSIQLCHELLRYHFRKMLLVKSWLELAALQPSGHLSLNNTYWIELKLLDAVKFDFDMVSCSEHSVKIGFLGWGLGEWVKWLRGLLTFEVDGSLAWIAGTEQNGGNKRTEERKGDAISDS